MNIVNLSKKAEPVEEVNTVFPYKLGSHCPLVNKVDDRAEHAVFATRSAFDRLHECPNRDA